MHRIDKARIAGKINKEAIRLGFQIAKPGTTLLELDAVLGQYILDAGCTPAFKGYNGFPGSACLSVNNIAVHGIPNDYQLKTNDLLTIDIGTIYDGIYADSARTHIINYSPTIPNVSERLVNSTERILTKQTEILRAGVSLLDIANAGEQAIRELNVGPFKIAMVESLGGHYIGEALHMPPFIPNTLDYRMGTFNVEIQRVKYAAHILKEDDVICIEPVTTIGPTDLTIDPDGWTCRTKELSAHFEHTIFITKNGYELLS